ncbi:MAG TPA: hypothetical protein PKJ19_14745 [Flavobacteriales bacterium]|nr:hypothetical protein [Flavobacteriales bacterium]
METYGRSCCTDEDGNVFMTGWTRSAEGLGGAHQLTNHFVNYTDTCYEDGTFYSPCVDAFLVKFDSNGNRIWATYHGNSGFDVGESCATDASGNVYMAGSTTSSTGMATIGAFIDGNMGDIDAFLSKFNNMGQLLWSTYYGNTSADVGRSCAVGPDGTVFLAGSTYSELGFSTNGALLPANNGISDAFIASFNSQGQRLWGTFYGGTNEDFGFECAAAPDGGVYLSGQTHAAGVIGGFDGDLFLGRWSSDPSRQSWWLGCLSGKVQCSGHQGVGYILWWERR